MTETFIIFWGLVHFSNRSIRYNKGDKVLGMEFGDHLGDWYFTLESE